MAGLVEVVVSHFGVGAKMRVVDSSSLGGSAMALRRGAQRVASIVVYLFWYNLQYVTRCTAISSSTQVNKNTVWFL